MTTATASQRRAGSGSWQRIALYVGVYALTLAWLVPVIAALITSVRTNDDIMARGFWSTPNVLTLKNFALAWTRGGLSRYLPNSFIITLPSLVLTLFLSSLGAYALARFRFRFDRIVLFIFVAGMMLPFQILLLPVFRLMNVIGLYNTYWALIIFHTAFQLGFCTFVLRNYMRTIPGEILEAARMDGCSEFRVYSADHAAADPARDGRAGDPGVHLDLQRLPLGVDPHPGRQAQAGDDRPRRICAGSTSWTGR